MIIEKEGFITITADGTVGAQGFHVREGTLMELEQEVLRRIVLAASKIEIMVSTAPPSREIAALIAELRQEADEFMAVNPILEMPDLLRRAADWLTHLQQAQQERDDALDEIEKWKEIASDDEHAAEVTEAALQQAREALEAIVTTYDAYRRRGVSPAPKEYGDVVDAIELSRAALKGSR